MNGSFEEFVFLDIYSDPLFAPGWSSNSSAEPNPSTPAVPAGGSGNVGTNEADFGPDVDVAVSDTQTIEVGWSKDRYERNPLDLLMIACGSLQRTYRESGHWNVVGSGEKGLGCYELKDVALTILTQPRLANVHLGDHGHYVLEPNYGALLPFSEAYLYGRLESGPSDEFKVKVETPDGRKGVVTIKLDFDFDLRSNAQTLLMALLKDHPESLSNVAVRVLDIAGSAVGRADESTQTILLDSDAAGHGWFIDATPQDNSEFLPTADPNLFIAKPGSAAEGKMDMLSVLLHEYGHALGLGHSSDSRDAMAAVLRPGVRHLLSVNDLALLYGLTLDPPTDSASGGTPGTPQPIPGQPPLSALGLMALLRRRQGSESSLPAGLSGGTQALTVSNPTLLAGDFSSATPWYSRGSVTYLYGEEAVLTESLSTQTALRQVFTLNPGDHYLRFTVDGVGLHQTTGGPGDAFEVALLDAATNLPLGDTVDLSRSDALLNRQSDGTDVDSQVARMQSGAFLR